MTNLLKDYENFEYPNKNRVLFITLLVLLVIFLLVALTGMFLIGWGVMVGDAFSTYSYWLIVIGVCVVLGVIDQYFMFKVKRELSVNDDWDYVPYYLEDGNDTKMKYLYTKPDDKLLIRTSEILSVDKEAISAEPMTEMYQKLILNKKYYLLVDITYYRTYLKPWLGVEEDEQREGNK